ncbi:Protein MEN-8 [Apostasia shenzhenica]|uniref:Protein MEN-8 n=1 Tax=Apostasia shenzhenica TaxID=1088818 RepID=A0A2I0AB48_9ASPA|nr:Protein MEN-8 [Apostasia shenzhenica]
MAPAMKTKTLSAFLVVLLAVAGAGRQAAAQTANCSAGLSDLTVCAPFVVPGAAGGPPIPSAQCCSALKGVNRECLCNTLDIISKLPSTCSLPAVSCSEFFFFFKLLLFFKISGGIYIQVPKQLIITFERHILNIYHLVPTYT